MIRNAIVHLHNEQPLLADLFEVPSARDLSLICTNLRTMNGQRPVFIERSDSTFVLPLGHIRFVEILASSIQSAAPASALPARTGGKDEPEADIEIDEDFLRRVREV